MNCPNSTAPIDINNNPTGTCELKCKYNFKYKESGSKLTNNAFYLSLTYDQTYPAPVKFNADSYQLNEIRIYSPSLHTYSGSKSDAEIIAVHSGENGNLLVCVPLVKGNKSDSNSGIDLENIISNAKKFARKENEETALQKNINMNNFIPNAKPFYSYKATLPYVPCNGEYNYIVFSKDDNAYVTISEEQLSSLNSVISPHSMDVKTNTNFYINKLGANTSSGKNDEIYIDCKPVSDSGDVIGEDVPKDDAIQKFFKKIDLSNIQNNIFFQILIAIILIYLIYFLFMYLLRSFGKTKIGGSVVQSLPINQIINNK